MSTSSLAIDIVLLPPPEISAKAIALSDKLASQYGELLHLNPVDRLPHISLLMGVMDQKDIDQVAPILRDSMAFLPMELEILGLDSGPSSTGLAIKPIPQIREMQQFLIAKLSPLLNYNPKPEMFDDTPTQNDLKWVKNFLSYSQTDFNPHITVGPSSQKVRYETPEAFKASTLALCHLGNYCTCRKILVKEEV